MLHELGWQLSDNLGLYSLGIRFSGAGGSWVKHLEGAFVDHLREISGGEFVFLLRSGELFSLKFSLEI